MCGKQLSALVVSLAIAAVASPAARGEGAMAEALFQAGLELAAKGDHAAACAKFRASDELDPSVGARISIGKCSEKQGKTASAWVSYKAAQNLASQKGDSRRAKVARREVDRLAKQLSLVMLEASAKRPRGFAITFNGESSRSRCSAWPSRSIRGGTSLSPVRPATSDGERGSRSASAVSRGSSCLRFLASARRVRAT